VISTLSNELEWGSGETASGIISEALSISVSQGIDTQLFSSNAASTSAPAGLLNGLTALTSKGTTAADGLADDLAQLASAIAAQGVNPHTAAIVCSAFNAFKIKTLASLKLTNDVFTALHIRDDTVILVVPEAFWTGWPDTNVTVEINTTSTVQFDDSIPAADPLTAPSRSLFQTGLIGVKVRADVAWAADSKRSHLGLP
jgi:hypothetical protein